jgi:hypothetical protein
MTGYHVSMITVPCHHIFFLKTSHTGARGDETCCGRCNQNLMAAVKPSIRQAPVAWVLLLFCLRIPSTPVISQLFEFHSSYSWCAAIVAGLTGCRTANSLVYLWFCYGLPYSHRWAREKNKIAPLFFVDNAQSASGQKNDGLQVPQSASEQSGICHWKF